LAVLDPEEFYTRDTLTLQPPALAQVNRRLRQEVIPIFYGKRDFMIHLPDVLDVHFDPVVVYEEQERKEEYYTWFRPTWELLAAYIQLMTSLEVTQAHETDRANFGGWRIGFQLNEKPCLGRTPIGNVDTDWNDPAAAEEAFLCAVALHRANHETGIRGNIYNNFDLELIADALHFFVEHCVIAKDIRLAYQEFNTD
jgi:hypothetical protein